MGYHVSSSRLARLLVFTGLLGCPGDFGEVACGHENHAPLPTKGVTVAGDTIMLSPKARESIGLTTAKVALADIRRTVTVNAHVELPWHAQAMITSLVPGKITHVLARPGEAVVPGQELARVVSANLESLQRALLQARAEVQLAEKLVEQRSLLDRQGVIAGKTLIEAQAERGGKAAALEIARQKLGALGIGDAAMQRLEESGLPLEHVSIRSPIHGMITHADVSIGQVVSATDHLYHVVDPSQLWIVGDVLESDVRFLDNGQSIEATFAARPDSKWSGRIDHMRPKMNHRTRTQEVVVAVDNLQGELRPGMFGRVVISVRVAEQAIVCPHDAVIYSRSGTYLLVQRTPGKYEHRSVTLGLTEHGNAEILDGVFPGDQVVVVGNALLASLMGSEHKARVASDPQPSGQATASNLVAVVHGRVELPTDRHVLATPQVEGRVRRILAQPAQQVSAGEVLAEIDSLELQTIQLDLLQTLSQAQLSRQSLQRVTDLGGRSAVPQRQVWEIESELQVLELRAEGLKRQLTYLGLEPEVIRQLEQTDLTQRSSLAPLVQTVPIRAPIAGRVVSFHVVPGQVVHRNEALFEIHDLAQVWVKGHVFERDASRVVLGQAAEVRFAAYPDLHATGKVVRISPTMDENERVLPVWIEVANPNHKLLDGMLARVTLLADSAAESKATENALRGAAQPSN